jgi:tetratricopeptide (TPR) repeat protein
MARADGEGRVTIAYEDRYALAAFPGFFLLLAALLLREARPARGRAGAPSAAPARGAGAAGLAALLALLLAGFSPFQAEEENVRRGNERLRRGDAPGAIGEYDAAERAVGSHPEIDFDRGSAAAREGRLDEARAALGRAAAAGPGPLASRALQNLGSALAAAGDRDGAVAAFSDALAKDPGNEDARWNLEVLLRKGGAQPKGGAAEQQRSSGNEPKSAPSAQPREPSAAEREEKAGAEARREEERKADAGRERGAEAREKGGSAERRREPLSRQEAEALLDALRAREKRMPLFGPERRKERGRDGSKDW